MLVKRIFTFDIGDNRIFGLDILRMLAIMFVVINHNASLLPSSVYTFLEYFIFDGVCIFFVLSGFLIGNIIIKSVEKNGFTRYELFNFWIRRWFRTLPNYYLFVLILTVLSVLFVGKFSLKEVFPFLFFCQNLFHVNDSFFGESWSLSVEEWFYLSIPLILFCCVNLFKIKFKKSLLIVSIFLLLFYTFLRHYMHHNGQLYEMVDFRRVVIMRIDNIMYGVIGAYISYYYQEFWMKHKYKFFIAGIVLVFIWKVLFYIYTDINSFYYVNIFYPLFCTAIFCLLPLMSQYTLKKYNVVATAITYISLISYSLYLIHYSLIKKLLIDHIFSFIFAGDYLEAYLLKNTFYWGASLLGAFLIYKYFEMPTTKLRDRIMFKSNKKSNSSPLEFSKKIN
ncbi:acyltransferase family protein [Chryseobacterium jejuense]|uniref:O-acetyltransferase OatA n=1 Tax=Chryseobacterium jejuense TaxID=445960 RepID=A0A2X2X8U1_CHRJE|nr:acyltransferase [Chryseobacterium jejuense]SDI57377.1 Peptidoglycan/LPS O-acetylase OafA/YrhL, contains acyltransferase and SGNH-hydrolase domains [Chryseobacterium jejuense]SQB47081.1 O-acetyltransferase OatA [Chryseobacterium jejuense]